MKYKVIWRPSAERRLTTIWLDARNRLSITEAVDALDERLRWNPVEVGESRAGEFRLVFIGPLEVLFQINEERHEVYIRDFRLQT